MNKILHEITYQKWYAIKHNKPTYLQRLFNPDAIVFVANKNPHPLS